MKSARCISVGWFPQLYQGSACVPLLWITEPAPWRLTTLVLRLSAWPTHVKSSCFSWKNTVTLQTCVFLCSYLEGVTMTWFTTDFCPIIQFARGKKQALSWCSVITVVIISYTTLENLAIWKSFLGIIQLSTTLNLNLLFLLHVQ